MQAVTEATAVVHRGRRLPRDAALVRAAGATVTFAGSWSTTRTFRDIDRIPPSRSVRTVAEDMAEAKRAGTRNPFVMHIIVKVIE